MESMLAWVVRDGEGVGALAGSGCVGWGSAAGACDLEEGMAGGGLWCAGTAGCVDAG